MEPRLNPFTVDANLMKPLLDFGHRVLEQGLEPSLMELVKIRASQLNHCGICLHMHTLAARKHGETEERLYLLDAWRESPLYTERERAALGWTDALTRLTETHAPDEAYRALAAQFDEREQIKLTMLISVINSFNRFGAGFRAVHPLNAETQAK